MVLNIFLRTLLIYLSVLLVMRLMGKREVGQLSTFDLVVAIMIAEVAVIPVEDLSIPVYIGLIPMFTLVGAEIFFSFLCLHSRKLRGLIEGHPSIIIANGRIIEREMRRLRYNINDLLGQLREKNIFNLSDVEYAILETSGELSVILKSSKRPLTLEDISIFPGKEELSVPLIVDGEVLDKNLQFTGYSRDWLQQKLHSCSLQPEDILFASLESGGKLYISEKEYALQRKI